MEPIPRWERLLLLGYPASFLSTRREKFPVPQGLLPCNRREAIARLFMTLPHPLGPPHQVPMSHAPTWDLRVPRIVETVSLYRIFLLAGRDVLPKILPVGQKWIVFSSSQELLDSAITRLPKDKTFWGHQYLVLTLSQEWVSCLYSRFNSPGLSSGWIHFDNEIKAPRLP